MSRTLGTGVALAFQRAALPLVAYYAVTLAVPLANGAARSGDPFVEHALVVLIVPLVAVVVGSTVHTMVQAAAKVCASKTRAHTGPARSGQS